MSRVFFTSDPHLGHPLMSRLRGFTLPRNPDVADVGAHDAWYVRQWRSQVTSRDLVYVLGDLTVGGIERERHALDLMRSLPGRKVFIAGNHDRVHPAHRDSVKPGVQASWLEVFDAVMPFGLRRMQVGGSKRHVRLSHFPYFGDHTREERFDEWRLKDAGGWLLHGHTHIPGQRVHDGRQIHVGIDAWGRLLSEQDIATLIAAPATDIPFAPLIKEQAPRPVHGVGRRGSPRP